MTPFAITSPGRILFGRGEAAKAPALLHSFGTRGLIVHGANPSRLAGILADVGLGEPGIATIACAAEPSLPMLEEALKLAQAHAPDWVLGLGGGSVMDLAKALAGLIPARGGPMDHLEVVGRGLPLTEAPLPFIAIPTTAGTGSEATKNAVIGLPDHGRKVSLRDDRMLARLAIVDPALTDGTPWAVTLASGLDAVTQVIEPFVSVKATPYTDAIAAPAIGAGLKALQRLRQGEDKGARDTLAWVSLSGGLALANAGLGAVHGMAGVIGGLCPAPHGAVCGALLAPILRANRDHAEAGSEAARRLDRVFATLAETLGGAAQDTPETLAHWAKSAGLPGLTAMGFDPTWQEATATAALSASSTKGNPVVLDHKALQQALRDAA
jgi:alcohol dehydrogenase class IV